MVSAKNAQRGSTADIDATPVASLAHEINNPLESLQNLLFLIESEGRFTAKGREYLSLANQELHRLYEITHGAMNTFRASANAQSTDIPALLRSVVEFYASRFTARSIIISTRYSVPEELLVQRGALRQMFSNVLLNAADAMPDGGRMHVRIRKAHEWRGLLRKGLRVTFADNGRGIVAENLLKITEPFFTTKGSSGTGLGLALVKDTVTKHSGTLQIRSSTRPGRSGSVFAIFLPAT